MSADSQTVWSAGSQSYGTFPKRAECLSGERSADYGSTLVIKASIVFGTDYQQMKRRKPITDDRYTCTPNTHSNDMKRENNWTRTLLEKMIDWLATNREKMIVI